jgi:hypothetical protein
MAYWPRKRASKELSNRCFPVAERTLISWPVPIVILNGKACAKDTDWLAEAERQLQAMLANQGPHLAPLRNAQRAVIGRAAARAREREAAAAAAQLHDIVDDPFADIGTPVVRTRQRTAVRTAR